MKPDDDSEPGFFSTPVGWMVIVLLVMVGLGLFSFIFKKGNGNNPNNRFDPNYYLKH